MSLTEKAHKKKPKITIKHLLAFEKFIKQNTNVSSILMHSSFTYEREIDELISRSEYGTVSWLISY